MRRIVVALAAVLLLGTTPAFAITTYNLTGSYSVSETDAAGGTVGFGGCGATSGNCGGPSISNGLTTPFNPPNSPFALQIGTETGPVSFFTASPQNSCYGGGCTTSGPNTDETDGMTVQFSGLTVMGYTIPTFSETATFSAEYNGSELACAVGDGVSYNYSDGYVSDCVVWSGASNTYNGSTMLAENLGGTGAGYTLDIFLQNATDWNVTPQVGFELVNTPTGGGGSGTVPEPASIGLMGVALAGLGLIRRRRNAAR